MGLRVVEVAALGPAPFCGMLLSDLGADVIRIDRPDGGDLVNADLPTKYNVLGRGRRSIALDLKSADDAATALKLIERADALLEGFRPGVMERLGLGPERCLAANTKLVYARMTGWGQTGPRAAQAGHDLNYIAISGAAHAIGSAEQPSPPLNLVGDFGGGALYLAFGVLAAILHARQTGEGQVVDCAMSEGAVSLMASVYALHAAGRWCDERGANLIDGAAPFYTAYRCSDGKWISVAALELKFWLVVLDKLGLASDDRLRARDAAHWREGRARLTKVFARETRAHWCALFEGADACVAPVLSLKEAPGDPQFQARNAFMRLDDVLQPAPVPRFSRTPGSVQRPPPELGEHTREVLADWLPDV